MQEDDLTNELERFFKMLYKPLDPMVNLIHVNSLVARSEHVNQVIVEYTHWNQGIIQDFTPLFLIL